MYPDDELAAALKEANRIMRAADLDGTPSERQRQRMKRRIFRRLAWERRAYVAAAFLAGFGLAWLMPR